MGIENCYSTENIKIDPTKIGDVIGAGGKTINKIIDETGVKIDIEDDGTVFVAGTESEMIDKAINIIKSLTEDIELNKVYMGKVTRILQFGALVEVLPGKEGLLHISQISNERIKKVEDALKRAYNPTINSVNITKFNQELGKTIPDLQTIYNNFSQLGIKGQRAFADVASSVLTTNLKLK